MNNEKELNIKVNPSSNTAITTLIMLANANYPQAIAILEKMGIKKETVFRGADPSDMINRPSDIVRELRYVALNRTIEECGFKYLIDLPCGYTPKVFEMTEKGMDYIGCDLPAVINDFAPVIDSMTTEEQKKHISFEIVDVTNYESMKAAADKADGPVCIATEGLTVYLDINEKKKLFENIRRILLEKGGCWLNSDAETLEYYMAVYKAIAGDRAMELIKASRKGFSEQSDTDLHKSNSAVTSEDMRVDYGKLVAMYERMGLAVEKIPYYRDDLSLHLFESMTGEEIAKLKENIKKVNVWKITAAVSGDTSEKSPQTSSADLPFEVSSSLEEGVFSAEIQGRMDTITSPELLKRFREAGEGGMIERINLDVGRMTYISSAGLRVLMIMYKSLSDKNGFVMTGVTDDVREILETTGFDRLLLPE